MTNKPTPLFSWSISGGIEALAPLAGVPFHLLFTDRDAIVDSWNKGLPLALARLWPEVPFGKPCWAHNSYGHVNGLGSTLVFPENSEVAHTPVFASLADGIRALERDVDFTKAGLFPFYLELWDKLKKAFPEMTIPFGLGCEGPVTTAWLLRGHDFFTDLYDDPAGAKRFLLLCTDSLHRYRAALFAVNGWPVNPAGGAYVADDGAAMVPPALWPEFVMPALARFYGQSTRRGLHMEDLTADHLPFLTELGITDYDPSVSRKISPALILRHAPGVPFTWRFNEIETADYTPAQTAAWVIDAAAQGAPAVATSVWRNTVTDRAFRNFHVFRETATRVEALLQNGCPRDRLEQEMRCISKNLVP